MGQALSVSRPAGKRACPQTRYRKRSALPAKDIREVTDRRRPGTRLSALRMPRIPGHPAYDSVTDRKDTGRKAIWMPSLLSLQQRPHDTEGSSAQVLSVLQLSCRRLQHTPWRETVRAAVVSSSDARAFTRVISCDCSRRASRSPRSAFFCHNSLFSLFRSRRSASSWSRRSCNQRQWARKALFSALQSWPGAIWQDNSPAVWFPSSRGAGLFSGRSSSPMLSGACMAPAPDISQETLI